MIDPDLGVSESLMERLLAEVLSRGALPTPVLQHVVEVDGRKLRLDVAYPDLKLGIEAHSRTFHWGLNATDADNQRDLLLGTVGWKILYVTWAQLQRPVELATLIERVAAARPGGRARS